jgi:hypothetical protein
MFNSFDLRIFAIEEHFEESSSMYAEYVDSSLLSVVDALIEGITQMKSKRMMVNIVNNNVFFMIYSFQFINLLLFASDKIHGIPIGDL